MTISQDPAGTRRDLKLNNLIKKPGHLKSRRPETLPAGPYLLGTLHAGSQVLDTLHLEHPLFKNPEILNAQNQLVRQPVTLQQAAFFIRFQQKGADLLVLTERLPASPGQELIRIKL
ncbi:MAG: hypothetical protein ACO1O1_14050 [Adhaeribacter sp.]